MESYILPNFPREFSSIHLCLFQNVTNSASLRARLVEAATMEGEQGDQARNEMDYGFVEASMVSSSSLFATFVGCVIDFRDILNRL